MIDVRSDESFAKTSNFLLKNAKWNNLLRN